MVFTQLTLTYLFSLYTLNSYLSGLLYRPFTHEFTTPLTTSPVATTMVKRP